jgi:TAG lipase/steryl ester hydrolase/phospholipase A2/LPA acyltransferase
MVLLEYLQQPAAPCPEKKKNNNNTHNHNHNHNHLLHHHNNNTRLPKLLPTSAPIRGYLCHDESSTTSRWAILRPAARILKGSADLVNNSLLTLRDGLSEEERAAKTRKEERRQILALRMKNAETMDQWNAAARDLDILEDNEAWKADAESAEFDAPLIEARLKQLDEARINCDIKAMLNLVRTALARDLGGMGNIRLYKHSHIGTKNLIERYVNSTVETIRSLVEISKHTLPDDLDTRDILERVVYARQAFGRSALLLSGGATFGMNHIGVLKALFEARLLPRIISGASAGSIVCAVVCTRTDEEIPQVLKDFPYGDLAVFEEADKEDGILERIQRLLTEGSWIDIKHLTRVMRDLLGDITFQEAYNRTRRILNICVSSASVYELPRLLNYVTSPNVMIWSAVAASCSVPLVFSAAQLLVKNPITGENTPWNPTPQKWIDGSVDNDLPMTRLAEMFNVNHFIVSQVNPHVVPFLVKDEEALAQHGVPDDSPGWVYKLTNLAKEEVLHRMQVLTELGIFPNLVTKARSVLSQKYSGDITILPQIEYKDFPRILKNPTAEFMVQACLCGEKATWPKLSRIRNHCAVELELDAAVQKLRTRVVFSPSQVDLRRLSTAARHEMSKRTGRKRRDSGPTIQPFRPASHDEEEEMVVQARQSVSRPPLRTASTYWNNTRMLLPPMAKSSSRSLHNTPLPTPHAGDVSKFEPTKSFFGIEQPQVPDVSSAGETTLSHVSSDADIDSHTDESSPETDLNDQVRGLGLMYTHVPREMGEEIDFFSNSQPVTTSTDRVLATSPASQRANIGLALTALPNVAVKREVKGASTLPIVPVSTPEARYQKMFHGQLVEKT